MMARVILPLVVAAFAMPAIVQAQSLPTRPAEAVGTAEHTVKGDVEITHAGSRPTLVTSPDKPWPGVGIVGVSTFELYKQVEDRTHLEAAITTFAPGARSAWHSHPDGELLIVTAGQGWVQTKGFPKRVITAGDTAWFPPGAMHWQGGTDKNALTHVLVSTSLIGPEVHGQPVSDAEYSR